MIDVKTVRFDHFQRSEQDILCIQPIRTILRFEEEITIVKKIRKVQEVDASPACPANSTQKGRLIVHANATGDNEDLKWRLKNISDRKEFIYTLLKENALPCIPNYSGETIKVKIDAIGCWNYGTKYHIGEMNKEGQIERLVDGDGNKAMETIEFVEGESDPKHALLFPRITPSALVAIKVKNNNQFGQFDPNQFEYESVDSGKDQEITLKHGEKVYFINNDQPGVYDDNEDFLTINWMVA